MEISIFQQGAALWKCRGGFKPPFLGAESSASGNTAAALSASRD
jgi:hypothetical protein